MHDIRNIIKLIENMKFERLVDPSLRLDAIFKDLKFIIKTEMNVFFKAIQQSTYDEEGLNKKSSDNINRY